jgi:hypothetical protein
MKPKKRKKMTAAQTKARALRYYYAHKAKILADHKKYLEEHKEELKKKRKKWNKENKKTINAKRRARRRKNKARDNAKQREYYRTHKRRYRTYGRRQRRKDGAKITKRKKIYYAKNPRKWRIYRRNYHRKWRKAHPIKFARRVRKYNKKNKLKILIRRRKWAKDNVIAIRKWRREYTKRRFKTDPAFKLSESLRTRLREAIKRQLLDNKKRGGSAVRDLGCTVAFLKKYIEKKFYGGMTWENWGKVWQLDHKKALFKFDLSKRSQLLKAVNYKNLQPLTIEDHKEKTAKEQTEYYELKRKGLLK